MAYNTKPIITDKDGNPISQYYNQEEDNFEPTLGSGGGSRVVVCKSDGSESNVSLLPILEKLSQLTGTMLDEETRKSNEIIRVKNETNRDNSETHRVLDEMTREDTEMDRIAAENIRKSNETTRLNSEEIRVDNEIIRVDNEDLRIELYEDLLDKLANDYFKGSEGDNAYQVWLDAGNSGTIEDYLASIKGEQGESGSIDNLTRYDIIDALGYTPIKKSEIPFYINNDVTESTKPSGFNEGVTLSNVLGTTLFPTIKEFGTAITFVGTNKTSVQMYITADNGLWVRRTSGAAWMPYTKILSKLDIVNTLTEITEGKVLDASQGKTLKDELDGHANNDEIHVTQGDKEVWDSFTQVEVVDNVESIDKYSALSANMGKKLKDDFINLSNSISQINLMPDSGTFGGNSYDPLKETVSDTFTPSTFFTPYNGSTTMTSAGKYIYNNTTYGGSAGELTQDVIDLLSKMGEILNIPISRRYGVEFHIGQTTMGAGTGTSASSHYLTTVNNTQVRTGSNSAMTMAFWVRIKSGNTLLVGGSSDNIVKRNGVLVDSYHSIISVQDGWTHFEVTSFSPPGYNNGFPGIRANDGDVIQIALPVVLAGGTGVGIHTSPIPTIQTDISGKMDKSGGSFGGDVNFLSNKVMRPRLQSYSEEVVILFGTTSTSLNLTEGNVFYHQLTANTSYMNPIGYASNGASSFTLIIRQATTVRTVTFPSHIRWVDGVIPDLSIANQVYVLTFIRIPNLSTTRWLGMSGGGFNIS